MVTCSGFTVQMMTHITSHFRLTAINRMQYKLNSSGRWHKKNLRESCKNDFLWYFLPGIPTSHGETVEILEIIFHNPLTWADKVQTDCCISWQVRWEWLRLTEDKREFWYTASSKARWTSIDQLFGSLLFICYAFYTLTNMNTVSFSAPMKLIGQRKEQ